MYRLLAVLLLAAMSGWSQFSSSIQGTVTDSSNAAVPDATVTVKNRATGITRSAKTSSEGFYSISNLGPGPYTVTVDKTGFATVTREGLDLGISAIARADVALNIGSVSERVDVTAQAVQLETEQGRVSGRIEQSKIQELPISGRNVLNLVALQPGIVGRGLSSGLYSGGGSDTFSGETQPAVYASGQRFEGNNYTLDDTSTNGDARNGVTNIVPNSESVEEVRVVANNFSAVDGRNPGAQVQMLSKGGTNDFHAVAAYYFTDNKLASRSIFDPSVLPAIRKHLYDFAGGGRIIKNRTFFFASYEGLRQGGARTTSATVETAEFRNFIVSTRPNSIAAYLLKNYRPVGDPTASIRDLGTPQTGVNKWLTTPDGIPDLGTVFYTPNVYRNANQFSIRLDHELRPGKDKVYGSYYRTTNRTLSGGVRPAFDAPQTEYTYFGNLNYSHIFSANKLNEIRGGVMQLLGRPDLRKELQVPGVTISGISGFSGALYPSGWWQTNYDFKDIFSWVHNTHSLKIGGELRLMRGAAQNTSNYIPSYTFNNLLDFADDEAYTVNRLVNPASGVPSTLFSQLKQREWALFIQDDWKVSRTLTVNLGLRYENFGTFHEKQGSLRNLLFGPGNNILERIASGRVDIVPQFYPTANKNFDPRFGFAWDPSGKAKWTVRGGMGVVNNRISTLPTENYRGNPPLLAQASLGVPFGTSFIYTLGDPTKPFVGYPVDPALQLGLDSRNGIKGARVNLTAVDPNLRTPYIYNWFVGIQHELTKNTVAEVNYIASAGHHLYNSINLNRFAGDMQDGVFNGLNPSFGSISMVQSTSNSIFNGATASLRQRFGSQFNIGGSYTYGKAIDDTDGETGTTAWQNAYDRQAERAAAGFDTRHRLTINGLWNMPFFKDRKHNRAANAILGGWQLSGFAIFDNGTPFNITNGAAFPNGDYNADNNGGDRPNAPTSGIKSSGWSRQEFLSGIFKVADFPKPAAGSGGNLGRNVYRGPGFAQTDLSLAKKFAITERLNASLRLDAYNALNRVNLSSPTGDLNNNNFGRVTGTNTPRLLQLGLRIAF